MKTNFPSWLVMGACLLLATSAAEFASEIPAWGPGRLSDLIHDSDDIVVVSCVRTQKVDVQIYTLDFAVRRQVKGALKSFTLDLGQRTSATFATMTGPNPALVFLQNGPDGKPQLTSAFSAVELDARDAALPSIISREIEIRSMPAGAPRNNAMKHFLLPLLAAGGDSYTQESLAEDLLDLCAAQHLHLAPAELTAIYRTLTNSESYKIAEPLALTLVEQDAPQADDACLHVFFNTEVATRDSQFRLASALAKRPNLREAYVQRMEQTQDSAKLGYMLTQLYRADLPTQDAIYERLWRGNPASRGEIEHLLRSSVTSAHDELLQRLKEQTTQR